MHRSKWQATQTMPPRRPLDRVGTRPLSQASISFGRCRCCHRLDLPKCQVETLRTQSVPSRWPRCRHGDARDESLVSATRAVRRSTLAGSPKHASTSRSMPSRWSQRVARPSVVRSLSIQRCPRGVATPWTRLPVDLTAYPTPVVTHKGQIGHPASQRALQTSISRSTPAAGVATSGMSCSARPRCTLQPQTTCLAPILRRDAGRCCHPPAATGMRDPSSHDTSSPCGAPVVTPGCPWMTCRTSQSLTR